MQPPGLYDPLVRFRHLLFRLGELFLPNSLFYLAVVHSFVFECGTRHILRIASQENVGTTPRHVGGDGNRAHPARLRHDFGFHLVVLRVQHDMLHAGALEELGQLLALADGGGTYQNGSARPAELLDLVDHGIELLPFSTVNEIGVFRTNQISVRRRHDDFQVVNLLELGSLRFCCSRHARQLLVHPEVVLEGDCGECLVLSFDLDVLFRFDRLMEPVGPSSPRHQSTRELVDDDDLPIFHHVVDVPFVQRVRTEGLVDVMEDVHLRRIVQVLHFQQRLAVRDAVFGQGHGTRLLVDSEIVVPSKLGNDTIDLIVEVGGFFGRSADDERRTCLVDENRIDLVHDGVVEKLFDLFAVSVLRGARKDLMHEERGVELHVVA